MTSFKDIMKRSRRVYTEEELKGKASSADWKQRIVAAKNSHGLEKLYQDPDWTVRTAVARRGFKPEILSMDKHWSVRRGVAESGYELQKFVQDENWRVRLELANQGYQLRVLMHDENEEVRNRAKYLMDSTNHIIARNFGTYDGNLCLHIWEDKYEITSGCYSTNSIDEWYERCEIRLNKDIAKKYRRIMSNVLSSFK